MEFSIVKQNNESKSLFRTYSLLYIVSRNYKLYDKNVTLKFFASNDNGSIDLEDSIGYEILDIQPE